MVTTRLGLAARKYGIYCEPCRIEAKKQNQRNYYDRNKHSETFLERKRHQQSVSYWENKLES